MGDLVLETKLFNLSTRGSSGNVLNADYKSLITMLTILYHNF